uniref:Uncharacterized protein n=1 Tax=Arundo donax TaxID=35708 RepID=A0A0A9F3U7_ARUDO
MYIYIYQNVNASCVPPSYIHSGMDTIVVVLGYQ